MGMEGRGKAKRSHKNETENKGKLPLGDSRRVGLSGGVAARVKAFVNTTLVIFCAFLSYFLGSAGHMLSRETLLGKI